MNIILLNIKNPKWNIIKDEDDNEISRVIDCECQWSHLGDETQEWLTFTANPNDTEEHGKQLYQDLIDGKHGEIADD